MIRLIILLIMMASDSLAYDVFTWNTSIVKNGTTSNCKHELAQNIIYNGITRSRVTGQQCYGDSIVWSDYVYSKLLAGCNHAQKSYCYYSNGTNCLWNSSSGYNYVFDGYACHTAFQPPQVCVDTGKDFVTCQEMIDYSISVVQTSYPGVRYEFDNVFDTIVYQSSDGNDVIMYYLFFGDYCNDSYEMKRVNNDPIQAGKNTIVDSEYKIEYIFHNNTFNSYVPIGQWLGRSGWDGTKWTWSYEKVNTLNYQFTHSEAMQYYKGNFDLEFSIPGTQCNYYIPVTFTDPQYWTWCAEGFQECGWYQEDGSCAEWLEGANWLGFDFPSDNNTTWTEWLSPDNMKLYGYTVNKQGQPTGPLTLVYDLMETGYQWIASPGDYVYNVVELQDGYRYRLVYEFGASLSQHDFSWWPCSRALNKGQTVVNKGSGVSQRGQGVKSTGRGGMERRN